jgi:hypothetical protein
MDLLNHLDMYHGLHHEHQHTFVFDYYKFHRSFHNDLALYATMFVSELDLLYLEMMLYPIQLKKKGR